VFIASIALVATTIVYHQVMTLVDLFPFNNIRGASRRERMTEALVNGPVMSIPLALLVLSGALLAPWLALIAGAVETVILLGGLALWWLPYLAGRTVPWATAGTGATWQELHRRTYGLTVIVLPDRHGRPRPNLEHMILHSVMLAATIACYLSAATS
jgi:hypothetical protein